MLVVLSITLSPDGVPHKPYWGSKPGPPTGFDGPNHGYEYPLGFDQTCEISREISPGALEASVIDILANSKIRFDSVKRMAQIQNTS